MSSQRSRGHAWLICLSLLLLSSFVYANALHEHQLKELRRELSDRGQKDKSVRNDVFVTAKRGHMKQRGIVRSSSITKDLTALKKSVPKLKGDFLDFVNSLRNLLSKLESYLGNSPSGSTPKVTATITVVSALPATPSATHARSSEQGISRGARLKAELGERPLSTDTCTEPSTNFTHKPKKHPATPTGKARSTSSRRKPRNSSHPRLTKTETVLSTSTSTNFHTHTVTNTISSRTSSVTTKTPIETTSKTGQQPSSNSVSSTVSSTAQATVSGFNSQATNNLAVYYGQTPATTADGLLTLCKQPSISIINLAFLNVFFGLNGWPDSAFGPACTTPDSNSYMATTAPGLQNCSALGRQITQCQKVYGKKIFVSLGGGIADSYIPSSDKAIQFANTIWNLFGPGTGANNPVSTSRKQNKQLRPFGPNVVVDGFDIDNENAITDYWYDFASTLRALYVSKGALATGKTFYLSSTPQCPRPDASIPLDVLLLSDFVNVQFYNNPPCNADTGANGFLDSVVAWANDMNNSTSQSSTVAPNEERAIAKRRPARKSRRIQPGYGFRRSSSIPKIFIGLPAWSGGAGSGYVSGPSLQGVILSAKTRLATAGLSNTLGGIMLWDGLEGLANTDLSSGKNFIDYCVRALK